MKGIVFLLPILGLLAALLSANIVANAGETISKIEAPAVAAPAVAAPRVFKRSRTRTVIVEETIPEVSAPRERRSGLFSRLVSRRPVRSVETRRNVRSPIFSRSVSRGVCVNGRCGN